MSSYDQACFTDRVHQFIEHKSITGRQNFQVTPQVKLLIAASAVQVTFGLETWDLSYFKQILIFPDEYKNPFTGNYHKGETNLGGFMCFSWKDFEDGNRNTSDKINLGLHEFGHALRFNGIKGHDSDYFFENYFPKWVASASKEFVNLRNHQESIFRKYGSVNINEFFSVVIETFFEQPLSFKAALPELFLQTSILLNQTFNEEGRWITKCRQALISKTSFSLSSDFASAFNFSFPTNGYFVGCIGFLVIGIFSLFNGGYLYPPPYFCFFVCLLLWSQLEKKYTRLILSQTAIKIEKGFVLFKGYKSINLPGTSIISLIGTYINHFDNDGQLVKTMCSATLTYYKEKFFYEEDLEFQVNQKEFELLCKELRKNSVHVFISD